MKRLTEDRKTSIRTTKKILVLVLGTGLLTNKHLVRYHLLVFETFTVSNEPPRRVIHYLTPQLPAAKKQMYSQHNKTRRQQAADIQQSNPLFIQVLSLGPNRSMTAHGHRPQQAYATPAIRRFLVAVAKHLRSQEAKPVTSALSRPN